MRIAVISDTHDHIKNLDRAVQQINDHRADALLHCGDLCSPFVVERLAKFNGPIHIVFGNNEGDRFTIQKVSLELSSITLHGELGLIDGETGRIAFTHMPEFAADLACTGEYSVVFFGHTHIRETKTIGKTRMLNPGDLMGLYEPPGWMLFDTGSGQERRFDLD